MSIVIETKAENLVEGIFKIIKALNLEKILTRQKRLVLKPNLTTNLPYPVTTSSEFVEILVVVLRNIYDGEILIAEGSGGCDTKNAFRKLGYEKIAKKFNIKLVDLNREERISLKNDNAIVLKEIWYPKILLDSFLISLPIPKDHSSAVFTCSLKNMFGTYLSKEFVAEYDKERLERFGIFVAKEIWDKGWNKGRLHYLGVHESIFDLNLYKIPNLTICDARMGVKGNELGGEEFKVGKVVASFDAVALDAYLAEIFGHDFKRVKYLVFSHKKLGDAEDFKILKV